MKKQLITLVLLLLGNGATQAGLSPSDGSYAKGSSVQITYSGDMPNAPQGDCCEGEGSWVEDGDLEYSWSGDVVGEGNTSSVDLNTEETGTKNISLTIKQNWKCTVGDQTNVTTKEGNAEYTVVSVKLVAAPSQQYSEPSIFPNICINAQTVYNSARYKVEIEPSDGKASVEVDGPGVIYVDFKDNLSDGDIITVLGGGSVGDYTLEIKHDEVEEATYETGGKVFKFKYEFTPLNVTHDNTSGLANADSSGMVVNVGTNSSGVTNGATIISRSEISIATEPSIGYNGDVKGNVRLQVTLPNRIVLVKGRNENGNAHGLSFNFGIVNYQYNGSGIKEIAAASASRSFIFDGASPSTMSVVSYDTSQFHVAYPAPFSFDGTSPSNPVSYPTYHSIDFNGSQTKNFDITIAISGRTTEMWDQSLNGCAVYLDSTYLSMVINDVTSVGSYEIN